MEGKKINSRKLYTIGLLLVLTAIAAGACTKGGGKCLTSYGNLISVERETGDFDSIAIYDYVNVFLTQDTVNKVRVETGEHVVSGISTEVVNRQLIIHNYNKCNWLRDYSKPVNVYISVRNLFKIYYNSAGNLTTLNPLSSDELWVDLWGGSGSVLLDLNIHSGTFIQHMGTADLTLTGLCRICSLYAGDYGPFHCENLETGYTFITSRSSNNCYVQAERVLEATILSIGDIYYHGTPDTLKVDIQGTGKLIPY